MYLQDVIAKLESMPQDRIVPRGFGNPHSYRGYYEQLAFEERENVAVSAMLADAKAALGTTYTGWKGGDYKMGEWTDCWLAEEGSTGEVIDVAFYRMAEDELRATLDAERAKVAQLERERDALLAPARLDELEHAGDAVAAWRAYHAMKDERDAARVEGVRLGVAEFVKRVNARAEADMLAGNPITGAHHRAIETEFAALDAEKIAEGRPDGA